MESHSDPSCSSTPATSMAKTIREWCIQLGEMPMTVYIYIYIYINKGGEWWKMVATYHIIMCRFSH